MQNVKSHTWSLCFNWTEETNMFSISLGLIKNKIGDHCKLIMLNYIINYMHFVLKSIAVL